MTRPGPPGAPGRGMRWVPVVVDDVRPLIEHHEGRDWKCDKQDRSFHKVSPCNATATAEVRPVDGRARWHYRCPNHLAGAWIEYGVGWRWSQEPTTEEE